MSWLRFRQELQEILFFGKLKQGERWVVAKFLFPMKRQCDLELLKSQQWEIVLKSLAVLLF